jgi:hypothetical protein
MPVQIISLHLLITNILVYSFSAIVAFVISFLSYRAYNILREKKYLYFSIGFFLFCAGLILHAVGNISFYMGIQRCLQAFCSLPQQTLFIAHMIHVILMFAAYTILIMLYFKVREKAIIVFAFVMAFMLAVLTYDSYLFNLAGFIFTLFIVYGAYETYIKNKNKNTMLPFLAFILIGLSHLLFIAGDLIPAYLMLFLGYLSFLLIFVKTRNDSKKK